MSRPAKIAIAGAGLIAVVAFASAAASATPPPPPPAGELGEGREFVPGEIVVGVRGAGERVVELPPGVPAAEAIDALADDPDVAYAGRNWIARIAVDPLDRGTSGVVRGWRGDQWNFLRRPGGVRVGPAWARAAARGRPGGAGVKVAVVDTGVAFDNDPPDFAISPGFTVPAPTAFEPGYDFVDPGTPPLDENGHGTHIAGTIAEQVTLGTPVGEGERDYLTGLAYGATVIPVRVLDGAGQGTMADVAAGIRWASWKGARVINLSLQLPARVRRCRQAPGLCGAIRRARARGSLVVAAAGNTPGGGRPRIAFPAAAPGVLAAGAATRRGCLAAYSDHGRRLDLIAPGGGRPRGPVARPRCLRDRAAIRQATFSCFPLGCAAFDQFAIRPSRGTSMAAAHASGVAALVRATRSAGANPGPLQLRRRLKCSSRPLGRPWFHGAGLLDAARATRPLPPRRCRG